MKHNVNLRVLGRVRLHAGPQGADSVVLPAKSLALLIYIAMERRPVRREVLADMFWCDTGDDGARANLRLALTKLRQRLPGVIHADAETVGIDAGADVQVDALQLLRAADTAGQQQGASALGGAVARYCGPFLGDFQLRDCAAFDDWVGLQRQRIDRSTVVLLRELVRLEQQARHVHNELQYLELWAQIEPWNEEPHMPLLRLLARVGSTAAALDRYEACRLALAEHQGSKPSPALVALAEDIRRGNVPPAAPAPALQSRPGAIDLLPLIGRAGDLRRIRQHLDRGERLVTVLGPAGVGKSRLARALIDEIAPGFPDGCVLCSFDFIGREASAESVREHLVAALGSALGLDFSQTVQPMAMLRKYLGARRAVLGLDGFETCIAAAHVVAELLEAAPGCVVIVTSRVRLGIAHEWLYELQGLAEGDGSADPGAALALLRACARRVGVAVDEALEYDALKQLVHLLEGSPLAIQFAAQSLRTLTPRQLVQRLEQGSWLDSSLHVPEYRHRTLQEVMGDMWEQLDSATQEAWARCALFRGTFPREWVPDCAGVSDDIVSVLVERCVVAREALGRCRMHELTRQHGLAMLEDLDPSHAWRRQFVLGVLSRLLALAPRLQREPALLDEAKADISTLAAAVQQALQWADAEQVDAPLAALCDIYHRLGWHFAAARLLEAALQRYPDARPAYRMAWHYRAGVVTHNQYGNLYDDAHLRAVLELGGVAMPAAGVRAWVRALGRVPVALASRPAAAEHERNAQRLLAHAIARLLMGRFIDGASGSELWAGLAAAWVAARRSGAADARLAVMLKALAFLGTRRQGWMAGWLVRRVRARLRDTQPVDEAFALQQLGHLMIMRGRWDVAEAYMLRAAAALASLGYGYDSLECRAQLNAVHLHQGNFPRLLEEVRITEVEARALEQPVILRRALMFKVQALLRSGLGGVAIAQGCLHDIHSIAVRRTTLEDIRLRGLESLVAWAQGDLRQVLLLAQEALDLAHGVTTGRFYTLLALALVVDVLLSAADSPGDAGRQARGLALQAVRRYRVLSSSLPVLTPRRLLYQGCGEMLRGRAMAAQRAWRSGLHACAAHASPYDAARLHLLLSRHGGAADAPAHAAEAVRWFLACGMPGPVYPLMPGG
ncbi:MAG: BTAD domain-containing putative transcriptional regulator [Ramlibacter sp.]